MLKVKSLAIALISAFALLGIEARAQASEPEAGCTVSVALRSNDAFNADLYRRLFHSAPNSVGICPWNGGTALAFGLHRDDCAKITAPSSIFRQVSDIKPMSQQDLMHLSSECFPLVRSVQIEGVHDVYMIRPAKLYSQRYKFNHGDNRGAILEGDIEIARAHTGVRYATLISGSEWVCAEVARGEITPLDLLDSTTLPNASRQYVERKYENTSCNKIVSDLFGADYQSN